MVKQTLKSNGYYKADKKLKQYVLGGAEGKMIALVNQKTSDENIHEILWLNGKSDLTEGGIDGVMEFVGEALE